MCHEDPGNQNQQHQQQALKGVEPWNIKKKWIEMEY
jgi:hypothetical protein